MRIGITLLGVLSFGLAATGQTTRPADSTADAWPKAVESLARALINGNAATVQGMLSSNAVCRRFDSVNPDEPSRMLERLSKSVLVGQHAYLHPPLVMAADIAADFKNSTVVPDKGKAHFLVDDESQIKRANATAVQWVVEQLDARAATPVGVIVLWVPRPVPPGSSESSGSDAQFLLCRGEQIAPGEFRFTTIVYGNPTLPRQ